MKIVMMKLVGNYGSDSANNDDDDDWNGDIELCIPGFKCHSRRQIPIFGQQCRPSEAKNRGPTVIQNKTRAVQDYDEM